MIPNPKDIVWSAQIEAPQLSTMIGDTLVITGVAVPGPQKNLNNWAIDPSDYDNITTQLKSKKIRLRKNHGDNVEDIIGAVVDGWRVGDSVHFKAEVDDPEIQKKILKGRVEYVSIAGRPASVRCSVCAKATRPFRMCNCASAHDIINGLGVKELSTVATPAYGADTDLHPMTFVSAMEQYLTASKRDASTISDDEAKQILSQLEEPQLSVVSSFLDEYHGVKPASMVKLISQIVQSNAQTEKPTASESIASQSPPTSVVTAGLTSQPISEIKMSAENKQLTEDPKKSSGVAASTTSVIAAKMCEKHDKAMPCPDCKASEESATTKLSAGPDAVILIGQVLKEAVESQAKALATLSSVTEAMVSILKARTDAGYGEGVPLPSDKVEDYKKWLKSKEDEKEKEAKKMEHKEEEGKDKSKEDEEAKKAAKKKEEEEAASKATVLKASAQVENSGVETLNASAPQATDWFAEVKAYADKRMNWGSN